MNDKNDITDAELAWSVSLINAINEDARKRALKANMEEALRCERNAKVVAELREKKR